MEFASDQGADEVSDEALANLILRVAAPYQMLVDALKLGARDMAEFVVDQSGKILSVYEGGNASGHDAAITRPGKNLWRAGLRLQRLPISTGSILTTNH